MNVDAAKRRAGEAAAEAVPAGATVGLGTGSTAAHAIRALGDRVDDGLTIEGVPTSTGTRDLAREAGVPLVSLSDVEAVDVAIDGADRVLEAAGTDAAPGAVLLKGGGGAHLREKVLASVAATFHVVVDERKLVPSLEHPIPLEVLPDARRTVAAAVRRLDGDPALRAAEGKDGPVVTDNGNLLIDADFGAIQDPAALAEELAAVPGVLEHGLFCDLADGIYVGTATGVEVFER